MRDYWIFGQGDIHVCPQFFASSFTRQVHVIVHEMGHKFVDMEDKAYSWEPKYSKLSTSAAMDNADSYASFAEEI